jgi:peroxiredoxin
MAAPARADARAIDVEVTRLDGSRISLRTLSAAGPLLVVLTRHFGCPGCSRTITELVSRLDELAALGVRVAVIGPGSIAHARAFLSRHGLSRQDLSRGGDPRWELLCDPDARAYAALEMQRSVWAAYGPAGVLAQARLAAQGFLARGPQGETTWLGGWLLLDRGEVVTLHRTARVADSPRAIDVLDDVLCFVARTSALPV